jgi:hypothetical protein
MLPEAPILYLLESGLARPPQGEHIHDSGGFTRHDPILNIVPRQIIDIMVDDGGRCGVGLGELHCDLFRIQRVYGGVGGFDCELDGVGHCAGARRIVE